jgi:hypothetical protein
MIHSNNYGIFILQIRILKMSSDGWDIMRQVWLDWLEENKVEIEDE